MNIQILNSLPNDLLLVSVDKGRKFIRICTEASVKKLNTKRFEQLCCLPPYRFLQHLAKIEGDKTTASIIVVDEFCLKARTIRLALEWVGIK